VFIHAFAAKAECLGAFIDCFIDSAPTWGPKDHETAGHVLLVLLVALLRRLYTFRIFSFGLRGTQ
jgi:hypothetical protein